MGLLSEGINEVIATTRENAAPIGLIYRNGIFRMHLYKGSHTLRNILDESWVVANIQNDPVIFAKTAFIDLPPDYFHDENVNGQHMHRLRETDAWMAFRAIVEKEAAESVMIRLDPIKEIVIRPTVRPVNRGFNSIIEIAVHGTRFIRNRDPELEKLILHHARLVRRCGSPREEEALDLLSGFLKLAL